MKLQSNCTVFTGVGVLIVDIQCQMCDVTLCDSKIRRTDKIALALYSHTTRTFVDFVKLNYLSANLLLRIKPLYSATILVFQADSKCC